MATSYLDQFNDKCILIFTNGPYESLTCTDQFCVAKHAGTNCRRENCKHHIILYTDATVPDILSELDTYVFEYLEINHSLLGYYKCFIKDESLAYSTGEIFKKLDSAAHPSLTHIGKTRTITFVKRLQRKVGKFHRGNFIKKPVPRTTETGTQTYVPPSWKRLQTAINSPYAADFLQVLDCFVDQIGHFESDTVFFRWK